MGQEGGGVMDKLNDNILKTPTLGLFQKKKIVSKINEIINWINKHDNRIDKVNKINSIYISEGRIEDVR